MFHFFVISVMQFCLSGAAVSLVMDLRKAAKSEKQKIACFMRI